MTRIQKSISFTLDADTVDCLDEIAKVCGGNRSEALRRLMRCPVGVDAVATFKRLYEVERKISKIQREVAVLKVYTDE